jgi:2'-5' RNA ligase
MSFAGASVRDGEPRRRPLVMLGRAEALSELHQRLGTVMKRNGLRGASSAFTPHMTLLYGPDALPRQTIEPIRFAVREFTLVHSERGLSRYNTLGRWRLKG